jgi:hypothetical protein
MSNSTSGISFINNSKPDPKSFNLIIHFKATVSGEPFVARKNYTNPFNESFSIEKFKFYFGKARLFDASSGAEISANPDEYFLIDFTDSVSCSIKLSIRPGKYSNIVFLLGVDSIHNVSGAQTGALDPAKGMFWTWNSGYIMAKLEGSSPLSNQPAHLMAYHIGGFREPNNAARNIDLSFPKEKKLEITDQKIHELYITADLNYWFNGPHPIHIKEIPDCTTPGILAKNISDNYTNMFSITQVIN